MHRLNRNDLARILAFRADVLGSLAHPDIYVPEADETSFVSGHLGQSGMTFGVFDKDRLVSYGMLGLPEAGDPDNLGRKLGLDPAQCAQVTHLASCMTLDSYRGLNIQRRLIAVRMRVARELGRRYCVAMVSLHNDASRDNLFAACMTIPWVGMIDTLQRQLMFVDMECPAAFADPQITIDSLDFEQQCKMTFSGWWGVGAEDGERNSQLIFKRPVPIPDRPAKAS